MTDAAHSGAVTHILIGELDAFAPLFARLPPSDLSAAQRFTHRRRAQQFLAGRALLRLGLERHYRLAFDCVDIATTEGVPRATRCPDLSLSVSHSGTAVACALSHGRPCGVDLQHEVDKPLLDIAEYFFARSERDELAGLERRARVNLFYGRWTLKEAWAKASGRDLLHALSHVRAARLGEAPTPHWLAWSFEPEPRMAGALVVSATEGLTAIEPTIALWRGDSFVTADFACRPVALAIKDA